jgi:hypothetical protein
MQVEVQLPARSQVLQVSYTHAHEAIGTR